MDNPLTPMTLLIIEDEAEERARFLECAKAQPGKIKFIGSTNSSVMGFEIMKKHRPEGVILDLELHKGIGSGRDFLNNLKSSGFKPKPIIIVATNTQSDVVYNAVRSLGVDFIHYKKQKGYSPESVIEDFLAFRSLQGDETDVTDIDIEIDDTENFTDVEPVNDIDEDDIETATADDDEDTYVDSEEDSGTESRIEPKIKSGIESGADLKVNIEDIPLDAKSVSDMTVSELDAIGMGRHYKGRAYLEKTIELLVFKGVEYSDMVFNRVADHFGVHYSSIMRAMQTAIENTWYDCEPEILKQHYTTYVSQKKKRPTPGEFVYFYADKIRKKCTA